MKLMRLAICVAAFAVVGGMAIAEDMDVKALQAKLAAQEARLNDLQAKMYGAACDEGTVADGITSLRKNAVVTLGGTLNTRYFYRSGSLKTALVADTPNTVFYTGMRKVNQADAGDFRVADAKLEAKIDVNDHFDAYLKLDFTDTDEYRNEVSGIAQNYWIRWKNISNTGFGVLVGRDSFKFGQAPTVGVLDSWTGDAQGAAGDAFGGFDGFFTDIGNGNGSVYGLGDGTGEGMFVRGGIVPTHSQWDYSRTTQINPYWENCDGSFKAELSFIQAVDTRTGLQDRSAMWDGSKMRYKSVNYGLGSMSGRITWKPIEGLKLTASAYNLYQKNRDRGATWGTSPNAHNWGATPDYDSSKNDTAVQVGFEYTPCFFDKMTVWATWQHGWNSGWVKDLDSDVVNAGINFNITDQAYIFAQGDFIYVKNDNGFTWHKAKGWGAYAGVGYTLPYGVNFEAGYRHDWIDYKDRAGYKHTKYKADTVYAHLGFNF